MPPLLFGTAASHSLSFSAQFPFPFLARPVGFIAVGGWPGRTIRPVRPFPDRACEFRSLNGRFPAPRFASPGLWPLLTSRPSPNALLRPALPLSQPRAIEISPGKSAVLRHTTASFTSGVESKGFAVWCQLTQLRRPRMRFLFIGSWLSPSLPPHGWSPFRS